MSEKITEIMKEIDKFKSAVANTDELSHKLTELSKSVEGYSEEIKGLKQKALLAVALSAASSLIGIVIMILLLTR